MAENQALSCIDKLQRAARIIETDGVEGFKTASGIVGHASALAMLIMHIRRNLGSTDTFPADPTIDAKLLIILEQEDLAAFAPLLHIQGCDIS